MKFQATIRYWRPERESGLAVADIPSEHIAPLGGLKQVRVRGTINGAEYTSKCDAGWVRSACPERQPEDDGSSGRRCRA